jgi:hypothetical protein
MKFAGSAVAQQANFAAAEALLDALAFRRRVRWLHSVVVAGAQFHGLEAGALQRLDDGFQVHVL